MSAEPEFSVSWTYMTAKTEGSVESLRRRIYYAARDGFSITLYALFGNMPQYLWKKYLEYPVEDDGQNCTPLIIAALNGHDNVIKMLVDHFQPDLEQEGVVQIDGYVIEGATPLWCAAGAGHYSIVKFLLAHGADINHATKSDSTPLRAACFDGRLPIITYLVENGANIEKANKYNNTCLMLASYRNHAHVVSYLLSKNINLDKKAQCGATALHFAAEHGRFEIVRILMQAGAKISKNNIGMTPLLCAAERTKEEVVSFFCNEFRILFTNDEIVEALELLGASYANDKDSYDLEKCYSHLRWAMNKRTVNPSGKYTPKKFLPPISAYDYHVECQTLAELEAIKDNENLMHMESLVVRERILGSNNPEVPHPVVYRGALYADSGRFDRCIDLWLHALDLRQRNKQSVRKDLLRFAQVFAQMIHIGKEVMYSKLKQVLEGTYEELKRNKASASTNSGWENEMSDNLYTALYLLVIVTKAMKKMSPEEKENMYKLIYNIINLGGRTMKGSTLLHLAVNADTHVDMFHTKFVCKFPCSATTSLLLNCGADVHAIDKEGNTPLHIIVTYMKPITDFMTLHAIVTALLEAGSHVDRVNNAGESALDAVVTGVAEIILKSQFRLSLKCIAAKAVKTYNIPYKGIVPESLEAFTDIHGPSIKK